MTVLRILIAISALGHFASLIYGSHLGIYITKPLTMLLIITLCLLAFRGAHDSRFTKLFLFGLLFSLAGDVFLMLPGLFLPGLFAFLLAHIFYVVALWGDNRLRKGDYVYGSILLVALVAVFLYLLPYLDTMLVGPVLLYMIIISLMVWRAVGTTFRDFLQPHQQRLVIIGALLFYISDLVLAINRFAHSLPMAGLMIMVPYFIAQYCLASSVFRVK